MKIKSMQVGGYVFQKVCLMFVQSKAKAENLYNAVAAPPLLLHMNKLYFLLNIASYIFHTGLWKVPLFTMPSKKYESRKIFLSLSCTLLPACRGYNRSAR